MLRSELPGALTERDMNLFRIRNCFFATVLFSAGALAAAQGQSGLAKAVSKRKPDDQPNMEIKKIGLLLHGGAGTIEPSKMTPEREHEYRAGLERALAAAIMDGKTLAAGAVASLKHIKNPVSLARLVMEKSGHVMMDGEGAEVFARENRIELVDQKYFYTQERWEALEKIRAAEKSRTGAGAKAFIITDQDRHGTVGAVALDRNGNLAAATSTGGTTNKRPGRVGDSPVIGAGTYANNASCAVSATGGGEYFIRATVAHDVSALMEYRAMSLKEAAQSVLDKVAKLGGSGGLIAIDRQGNIALPFNTSGMYRGYVNPNGKFVVEIYK